MRTTAYGFLVFLPITCFAHQPAQAAEPVEVFGLPVGGKVPAWKVCPSNTDKAKSACWIDKPFVHEGVRLGSLHLPNPNSRPAWAAYVGFTATVSAQGVLQTLKASTVVSADRSEIANSIGARWGLPTTTTLYNPGIGSATWSKSDITIEMLCQEKCYVEFQSAANRAERERSRQEQARRDAVRPVSP